MSGFTVRYESAQHDHSLWLGNIHKAPLPIKTEEGNQITALLSTGFFRCSSTPLWLLLMNLHYTTVIPYSGLSVFDGSRKYKTSSSRCRLQPAQTLLWHFPRHIIFYGFSYNSLARLLIQIAPEDRPRPFWEKGGEKHLANANAPATDKVISVETSPFTSL